MDEQLTPQQKQAVNHRGGNLLVSAAAGSGKTKVLVDRLMRYLMDPEDPANIDEFLIITYTKAAAAEVRGKIAAKLSEKIAQDPRNKHMQKQMQRLFLTKISTVHGFCADILREYAYRLDLAADFRVADENECQEIRVLVLRELLDSMYARAEEEPDFRAFIDSQGLGRDDRLVPEIILKVYDSAKCHRDPNRWLETCLNTYTAPESDIAETRWGRYLIGDLKSFLEDQIRIFERCIREAELSGGLEKVIGNLKTTTVQLRQLAAGEAWEDFVKNRSIDFGRLTFPRKNVDQELAERIKAARNACKKNLEKKLPAFSDGPGQILEDMHQNAGAIRGLVQLVERFDNAYRQAKQARRVLDFGDLEHRTLDLLLGKNRTAPTAAAAEIGRRFREIMVDEYQDSNQVQDAIFSALTGQKQNCFMVGDVKQSIYQFRLADPGIFLEKYRDYSSDGTDAPGRKILLSHNFRSGPEILEAVNDVFFTCMTPRVGGLYYGQEEALREWVPKAPLPDPAVEMHMLEVQEDTYREEAELVARKIQDMLQRGTLIRDEKQLRPVTAEDIVILLRSPGSVGRYYQRALEDKGILCASGGGSDLLAAQEVATFRSLLQIIVNPRQDIPLLSAIASPVFGFTADELSAIRGEKKKGTIYDAMLESDRPRAAAFLEMLKVLRRDAKMKTLTGLLESCFRLTRIDSIYGAMDGGEAKKSNLQAFFQLAVDFEKSSMRDVNQFLEHLDALEGRGIPSAANSQNGAVTIMSIHKSKGLEFPVVILAGLSRSFNRESLRDQVLCDKTLGIGLSVADTENRIRYPSGAKRAIGIKMAAESLSEEMRVLYVAMTRARDRLIMVYSAKNPEAELTDIALRMDFDKGQQLCQDANCPGEWVLMAAMHHMEAGALHSIGGRPGELKLGTYPWKICVTQAAEEARQEGQSAAPEEAPREDGAQMLGQALAYTYPYEAATRTPSKQTATGRKGRTKDTEAAENTRQANVPFRKWRSASFLSGETGGREYGNAIHAAMQFIRYEACSDEAGIAGEVERLVQMGFLRKEQAQMIDIRYLAAFFATDIGRKLRAGTPHVREFKFSVLDAGEKYGEGLAGEQVLLQGVVDCALLEPEGITIVDFKTDAVTENTAAAAAEGYRSQVQTYAEAMERIYQLPVKRKVLYFFRLNRFVEV